MSDKITISFSEYQRLLKRLEFLETENNKLMKKINNEKSEIKYFICGCGCKINNTTANAMNIYHQKAPCTRCGVLSDEKPVAHYY